MLNQDEKKELIEKLRNLQKEVSDIKNEVTSFNLKKEETFSKKSEVSKQIRELIGKVKDSKVKRDEKTKFVKEEKEKRQKLNEEIKGKFQKLGEAKSKVDDKKPTFNDNASKSPGFLRKEIKSLEYKIETEGMSFDKEKKMMKVINQLKKQLVEAEKNTQSYSDLKNLKHEINPLKKDATDIHQTIQKEAQASQMLHTEMIESSKKIDELKNEEKTLMEQFTLEKKSYSEANERLKAKLDELSKLKDELNKYKVDVAEDRKDRQNKSLAEKVREVEEKIKKGEKLTTEDLLIMQSS